MLYQASHNYLMAFRTASRTSRPDSSRALADPFLDKAWTFGLISAILSLAISALLSFTGIAARQGKPWAAGKSARQARRHRRTRSGHVVPVPEGTVIPAEEVVTVGEVEAARGAVDERTGLLEGMPERAG